MDIQRREKGHCSRHPKATVFLALKMNVLDVSPSEVSNPYAYNPLIII